MGGGGGAGRTGASWFCGAALALLAVLQLSWSLGPARQLLTPACWGLHFCFVNLLLRYCYRGFLYEVSVKSTFLGCVFATGIWLSFNETTGWRVFGVYMVVMSFFHFSEFFSIAMTNPTTLSSDSFILNHSVQYGLAAVSSWIEWGLEFYFFPIMKSCMWLSYSGLAVCILGECLRKGAMFTARTNFNHIVQSVKHEDHKLVTHGVYAWSRHPSYVGWFYWSIGTQIILLNPVCVVLYAVASWLFFKERVFVEEYTLLEFFGDEYATYQKRVGTGLPFIKGYLPEGKT